MNIFSGFEGDYENSDAVLTKHSTDASVFKVRPQGVLYPRSVEDISLVVKTLHEKKKGGEDVSLSVRAGGTCMSGGSLHPGYILNLTRYMNKIEVNPEALTATVEMGAYFRDIEAEALKHGLMFASYPSSKMICGIGGMIGNNASGEQSLRHGATIDNVISLQVVLADGSLLHTTKVSLDKVNSSADKILVDLHAEFASRLAERLKGVRKTSSGYRLDRIVHDNMFDIAPLFVGAQGTLGIVTHAVLRLVPISTYTRLLLVSIDSLEALPAVLKTVLTHNPECVETFDVNTFKRAEQYLAEDASRIKFCFADETHALVLVELSEDTQEETDRVARQCVVDLEKLSVRVHYVDDQVLFASAWNVRRHSFSLMRDNNESGFRAVPCIEDSIVPLAVFDVFVGGLIEILARYNLSYAYHGHIGEGALRVIPIFDMRKEDVADTIISFTREVVSLLSRLGGNPSADHSDGIIRSPFLKEFYGEDMFDVFHTIKELFDPMHILNPYKKTGGTEENIRRWLDR
ncbi:MAG: FAD-binding oxidoreductase [Candidatus Zambryskibacteria bacterium]|nr:FAD-binding oxidoreductase [Candidatus Zambryskibacteria bacterium]